MWKCMRLAVAGAVMAAVAGAATRAQETKSQDAQTEERIKQQLEEKKRGQEQATKDAADQRAESPETRIARAKLLADSQHDYEKALALAATVTRDTKGAPELRAQALVISARCLNQLGKPDEAKNRLRLAAQLNGPAADEAKRLLDGGLADPQLELRIAKAIEEIFGGGGTNTDALKPAALESNQTARDLIWVGAPAVPRLAKVLADVDHLASVTGAACLLGCIGNADAAAAIREALKRPDPLYRRAVLRGFEYMPEFGGRGKRVHPEFWEGPVREASVSLLQDRDARVRESMLNDQWKLMTTGEMLAATRDPEDAVRIAAWKAIHRQYSGFDVSAPSEELLGALRRCLKEDRDPVRVAAADLLGQSSVKRNADGRELAFESMLDPVLTGPDVKNMTGWMSAYSSQEGGAGVPDRPLPIELLVRVAERFGKRSDLRVTLAQNALSNWIGWSAGRHDSAPDRLGWDAGERSKVWQLVRWGYGPPLLGWILANATPEDVPTIVDQALEAGTWNLPLQVVAERAKVLSLEQRDTIARSLVRAFDSARPGLDSADKNQVERVRQLCWGLIYVGAEFGDEKLIRSLPDPVLAPDYWIATRLLLRSTPAVDLRLLGELASLPTPSSTNDVMVARNDALARLAEARSPELPKVLAKCYERGLNARSVTIRGRNAARPRGFVLLVARDFGSDEAVAARLEEQRQSVATSRRAAKLDVAASWEPRYSEAEVRAAFEACAALHDSNFWIDAKVAVDLLPDEGPYDPVAMAVLEAATRLVATAPLTRNDREPPEIVGALLQRRAPGWEELAMNGILDTRWRDAILKSLPEVTTGLLDRLSAVHDYAGTSMRASLVSRLSYAKDPAVRARAPGFLKDESGSVREAAIGATLATDPEHALDLVLPLAKDPDTSVRIMLCKSLGSVFDRRAIPALVDLLQDSQENVRVAAKTSLDSLQYTFDQKEKWKRVLEGGGLDSNNAAEALVKQAAAGQPKATRLVAIESLGTLGVAETLPVLIQFMGDGDAEIAAAAKDAVARINRQSKAGKDAGDAKSGKDGKPADH